MRGLGVAAAAGLTLWAIPALAAPAPTLAAPQPKLVVAISVDQLSGNLFDEWRGKFTGGLKRLSSGIAYTRAYQSHAATETCPGHSTLLTGKRPNKTGIVGNNLRDPETGRDVYCLLDRSVVLAHDAANPQPIGPQRLMASTLGEWMKAASPASKVVSVAGKDRGSVTMAGRNPDGVFWLFPGYGFTTYVPPGADGEKALQPVAAVNAAQKAVWTTRPTWNYGQDADCKAVESSWDFNGRAFNSALPPTGFGASDVPQQISGQIMGSPIPDDLTLAAARSLIKTYKLGQGAATDLLTVSFSATDFVGHRYGTRGPEMCSQMRRLDRTIGTLLSDLDALKIPYLVVLSADHGGSDFTERMTAEGYPEAQRVNGRAVLDRLNAELKRQFSLTAGPFTGSVEELFFKPEVPASDRAKIAAATAAFLSSQPEMAGAYTLDDLLATTIPRGTPADEFTLKQRFAASVYRGRSGDVMGAFKPGATGSPAAPGAYLAGHGSPWNYDRHVPILFWWNGAPREDRFLPIETVDIAPTLASVLKITPPADLDGRCLALTTGACGQ